MEPVGRPSEAAEVTASCESCGAEAHVRLPDESEWCLSCHTSAVNMGYDDGAGAVFIDGSLREGDVPDVRR